MQGADTTVFPQPGKQFGLLQVCSWRKVKISSLVPSCCCPLKTHQKIIRQTFFSTAAPPLFVANLSACEKTLAKQARHELALDDFQHHRTLRESLGQPITTGNRSEVLHNGDRIFPSMFRPAAMAG